jgi:hypothetical protein
VLVKNQSLSQNNGIYLCASGSWTRTTDANTWDALTSAFTFIEQGTTNADCGFVCTANAGGTLGTTALPWSQFSGAGTFTAGTGLTLTGSVFSLTTPVAVANGGTGLTSLGSGVATFLGTPSSANLAAAVSDETGSGALVFATSPTLVTPSLGTPSALVGTNITGTASGLTAGNVTTNANLTGAITSVGNATSLGSFSSANLASALTDETGSGANVFATSPTLVTPILGTPQSGTLTSCTGLPISTGVSGLGTGIATALAVNTGSAGAPVLFNGALGTPTSGTVTNLTGTASININGTVGATTPSTGAFTTVSASGDVTLAATSNLIANKSVLIADGTAGTATGAIYFINDTDTGFYRAGGNTLGFMGNGASLGTWSPTGLAVTGALSATGNLTLSAANPSLIGGTNAGSVSIQNPDAGAYISIYGSTHATKANKIEIVGTGGVTLTNGLAVTGALSSTGVISSGTYQDDPNTGTTDSVSINNAGWSFWSRGGVPSLFVRRRTSDGAIAQFYRDTTQVGSISVTTTATAYNTSSDARLKTNVRALTGSGAIIDALKPSVFDWKTGQKNSFGFIAQETFEVFPSAVTKGDDNPDLIEQQWAMDAGKFMPIAIAELKSLRARVAALESK